VLIACVNSIYASQLSSFSKSTVEHRPTRLHRCRINRNVYI